MTDRKEKKRPLKNLSAMTPGARAIYIQRKFNPPLGGLPVSERESLRAVILQHAPDEYQCLCRAGCDSNWLIICLYAWAWWPDNLLRSLQKEEEEGGRSLRQERDKMMRMARGLERKAVKMKYPLHRSAFFVAANHLRAGAKYTTLALLPPAKLKEQDLRGKATHNFFEWVQRSTKGRRFIGTVGTLLRVTANHFNNLDHTLQIYLPTKSSLQANLRRGRRTSK